MYRSQKETQLIYFMQQVAKTSSHTFSIKCDKVLFIYILQVEMYGNDMHQYLIKNQMREDLVENNKEPQSPTFTIILFLF